MTTGLSLGDTSTCGYTLYLGYDGSNTQGAFVILSNQSRGLLVSAMTLLLLFNIYWLRIDDLINID